MYVVIMYFYSFLVVASHPTIVNLVNQIGRLILPQDLDLKISTNHALFSPFDMSQKNAQFAEYTQLWVHPNYDDKEPYNVRLNSTNVWDDIVVALGLPSSTHNKHRI